MEIFLSLIYFINDILNDHYLFVFIIYFILLIIFYSLSLPGSPIPSIASGFFFGFYIGFLINIFSIVIGSYIFVFIAKHFFGKKFQKYYIKFSNKINILLKNSSYEYLILLRLILGNPLLIQNLCLSFTNISKVKFFVSSFIGLSPLMILFSYTGSKISSLVYLENLNLKEVLSLKFMLIILIIICFLVFSIIIKRIYFIRKK